MCPFSPLPPSSCSLVLLLAEANRESAGRACAKFQPESHHNTESRRMNLELRDNSLMTYAVHPFGYIASIDTLPHTCELHRMITTRDSHLFLARCSYLFTETLNVFSKTCSVAQLCPALCDPMDCSPPGSSVLGIFQAKMLEWFAISYSRGSSRPKDQACISCVASIGREILYH